MTACTSHSGIQTTMGDKSSKIQFTSVLDTFFPFPPNNADFSISSITQTEAPTQHWTGGAEGIREIMLDANKIEQMHLFLKVS